MSIDKNVPIPSARHQKNLGLTQKLKQLEIGDSFLLAERTNGVYQLAKHLGIKIIARKTDEGMRVWRVSGNGIPQRHAKKRSVVMRVPIDIIPEIKELMLKKSKNQD